MSNVIDIDLGTQVGAPITTGLTDDSIVFGASGGQGAAAPDDIAALGLWNYALAKMASDGVNARAALSVYSQAQIVAGYYTQAQTDTLLALKAPLASPVFTGNPTAPTQSPGNNTQRLATTAYVDVAIASLINSAPGVLDTLGEIATALQADESTAAALATTVAGKLAKASNLADLPSVSTARGNLGLGSSAVIDIGTSGTKVPLLDGANTWSALQTASGGIAFAAGLVNAPGIFPIGDTNTGLWAPAADTLALSTGGTERVRVDNSGFVGIGTTAPLGPLHAVISGTGGLFYLESYTSISANNTSILNLRRARGTLASPVVVNSADRLGIVGFAGQFSTTPNDFAQSALIAAYAAENFSGSAQGSYMTFETTTAATTTRAERMRIDSAGNILVGYTTKIAIGSAGTTYPSFQNHGTGVAAATETYRWSADANGATVGMAKSRGAAAGTRGAVVANDSLGSLIAHGDDGTNFISSAAIQALVDGTVSTGVVPSRLVFQTTSAAGTITERMRIDSAGNVGIGTTAAAGILHAVADGASGSQFFDSYAADSGSSSSAFNLRRSGGTVASPTAVLSGTRLGFISFRGKSDTVAGNFLVGAAVSAFAAENFSATAGGSYLTFDTTTAATTTRVERMRIDSAGFVGIGTASPGEKLTVSLNTLASLPSPPANTVARLANADGTATRMLLDGFGTGASTNYSGRAARGTAASPSALHTDDVMVALACLGYGATGYTSGNRGSLTFLAAENWTDSAQGSYLTLSTTAIGAVAATERARIDSAGRLIIGLAAAASAKYAAGTITPLIQTHAAVGNEAISSYSADALGSNIYLTKSRHATVGSHTIVQSGDALGALNFGGSDGTNFITAAQILVSVDGTPGASNDMPGNITFWTTPDGSGTLAERMRIDNAGLVTIGGATAALGSSDILSIFGDAAANFTMNVYNAGATTAPQFISRRARGTKASPTAVQADDRLFTLTANGYDGSAFTATNSAAMFIKAAENFSGTAHGSYITIETTTATTTTRVERLRIDSLGNIKIGGTAARGTTESQGALCLFDAAQAPVGTLANGITLYSAAGECRVMDSAGNSTLLSPHDEVTNEWIYHSIDTQKNRFLGIEVERMLRAVNDEFGWDFVEDGDVDDVDDHSSKTWRTARRASKRHERESTLVDLRKRIEALEAKLAA